MKGYEANSTSSFTGAKGVRASTYLCGADGVRTLLRVARLGAGVSTGPGHGAGLGAALRREAGSRVTDPDAGVVVAQQLQAAGLATGNALHQARHVLSLLVAAEALQKKNRVCC